MSTQKIEDLWVVAYDDGELIITKLSMIVDACYHAFTGTKPVALTLPILSIWETESEANGALKGLREFEAILKNDPNQ